MTVEYSSIMNGQDSIATNENGTLTWGDGNIDVDPMLWILLMVIIICWLLPAHQRRAPGFFRQ
jgi:hypothetical protein